MPEGDTIAWAAKRLRPVLVDQIPDEIASPRNPTWAERLAGLRISRIDTHGKHLFIRFAGGLVLHSHLGMVGYWVVLREPPSAANTWLVLRSRDRWATQRKGPTLELMTDGRTRFDQRLSALGPDVLAPEFDRPWFLARLRGDDPTRPFGDAILDQRNVAGIGNIWKAEGCWEAGVDPWRRLGDVSDAEALAVIDHLRPRMQLSADQGPRAITPRVYKRTGQPCPRCGTAVLARGQGDVNRTTYWCPGCQD